MNYLKKTLSVLVLVAFLVIPILQISGAYAVEPTVQEKTTAFLSDVLLLDMSQYDVKLLSYGEPLYSTDGIIQEEVRYELLHDDNKVDATVIFENGVFSWCQISHGKDSLLYTKSQPPNVIDAAKGLIERYQLYSKSSHFQELIDVINTVDEVKSTTVTLGNVRLQIKVSGLLESFTWFYVHDDLEIKALSILFDDGDVWTFREHWSAFKTGSTAVHISEEDAVTIALKAAKDSSWRVNGTEINDFVVLDKYVRTELSMQVREQLTLYPHWRVDLSLDKVYPGGVSSIAVGLWADTGEVRYCKALSYGTGLAPESSTDTSNGQTNFDSTLILLGVTIGLAITTVAIKKKRK